MRRRWLLAVMLVGCSEHARDAPAAAMQDAPVEARCARYAAVDARCIGPLSDEKLIWKSCTTTFADSTPGAKRLRAEMTCALADEDCTAYRACRKAIRP